MTRHYTQHLGAVPAMARRDRERQDPMLAHTGHAARRLLQAIKRRPASQQRRALDRVLADYDPLLPTEVNRLAAKLRRQGASVEYAVERALALALADATVRRARGVGERFVRGEGTPVGGLGGFGGLGDEAADVVAGMAQGIACSTGLRDQTATMVGMEEGADAANATRLGFEILRGVSQCPAGTTPVPPPPPPEPEPEGRSPVVPIVVGIGVLAAVGGVAWFMTRKK